MDSFNSGVKTNCKCESHVVARKAQHKFFVSYCGSSNFFQKHTLVHSKIKLLFFQECLRLPFIVEGGYSNEVK